MMQPSRHPVIAVDGTAASGKSTFSRRLAERLGYACVNTGAMYRAVTWYLLQRKIQLDDAKLVAQEMRALAIFTGLEQGRLAFTVAGIDPLPHIRDSSINAGVSLVAQVPAVRSILVAQQQALADLAPLVMEGRDIGSVVFPQTPYKFYLDADPEVRARRRREQGESDSVQQRDHIDMRRITAPLTCGADALRLDSGRHSVEELVERALAHLRSRGLSDL